jgi:hypothetical protein
VSKSPQEPSQENSSASVYASALQGELAFFLFGLSLLHGNRFVLAGTVIALAPLMETTLLTVIIPVRVDSLGRRSFQVITIFLVWAGLLNLEVQMKTRGLIVKIPVATEASFGLLSRVGRFVS